MSLIFQRPWTRQPQFAVGINPSAVGLKTPFVAVNCLGLDGYNYGAGQKIASVSADPVTPTVGFPGRGLTFTGSTISRLQYNGNSTASEQKFTAASVFVWRSGGANLNTQLCGTSILGDGFGVVSGLAAGGDIGIVKAGVALLSTLSLTSGVPYAMVTSHNTASGDYYILLRNMTTGAITTATQTETSSASASSTGSACIGCFRTDFNGAWNGDIFMNVMSFEYLPRAAADAWLKNPWAIFKPLPRRIWAAAASASPDRTAALIGNAGTGSPGTTGVTHDQALTGNAATGAVGTVSPALSIGITNNVGTGSVGTVAPSLSVPITGNAGTGAVGNVSRDQGDVTLPVTGNEAAGSPGTVSPALSVGITNNVATGSVGTLAPDLAVSLSGNAATGAVGNVTATGGEVVVAITGVSAIGSVGDLGAIGGVDIAVGGGRVRRFGLPTQTKGETEEERTARRVREGTIPDTGIPASSDTAIPATETEQRVITADADEYAKKSAKLQTAAARIQGENQAIRAEISKLEAKKQTAKAEKALLLKRQELVLAEAQAALVAEQLEVIDVAYVASAVLSLLQ